jgi:hypothetical protein
MATENPQAATDGEATFTFSPTSYKSHRVDATRIQTIEDVAAVLAAIQLTVHEREGDPEDAARFDPIRHLLIPND